MDLVREKGGLYMGVMEENHAPTLYLRPGYGMVFVSLVGPHILFFATGAG